MSDNTIALAEFVRATAAEFDVPGVAVGIWSGGAEIYVSHGVNSIVDPEPVDRDTVFVLGSLAKPFTATALMRLVADGRVELDAPVRRYLPEFTLPDEQAAAEITVRQLLNHTAGLDWRLRDDTGEGDDALASYVAKLADLALIGKPGEQASYSQIGFNLAGRIIEKVTGETFENAVGSLLLEPAGLAHTTYADLPAVTHRVSKGHNRNEDGTLSDAGRWKDSRANNAGGAAASSVADVLRLARLHLRDGRTDDGVRLLPADLVRQMREPTVEVPNSSLADAFGICWFLKEIAGTATFGHGGSTNGQFTDLLIVPGHDFAITVATNEGPDGGMAVIKAVTAWALEHYLGLVDVAPEPIPFDPARAAEIVGTYGNDVMTVDIATDGTGLTIECMIRPEIRAAAGAEVPADLPAAPMGLLPGDTDEYIVTAGGLEGQRGRFSRAADGTVTGFGLAGRAFTRR
ncbi:serine hydrolase domain-containing protein [Nocardia stercoris]|uniref:Class A beta-lactamase-related serine hydrolase n=1 Tax=Nocardia stercoris TaxID=2483361 RepID=A0A3M2LFT9_9NOCA|nr:serine hydrolase domain-containing protein [Nocardia stercoris]RMI34835.1 class A beta-lactamase-related serine hydrolase [Nocardia stercoris]